MPASSAVANAPRSRSKLLGSDGAKLVDDEDKKETPKEPASPPPDPKQTTEIPWADRDIGSGIKKAVRDQGNDDGQS